MRLEGLAFETIAKRLGYASEAGARRAYHTALDRVDVPNANEHRKFVGTHLRKVIEALTPIAHTGDPAACAALTRAMESYARVFGLTDPTRIEVTGAAGAPVAVDVRASLAGMTDEELERLVRVASSQVSVAAVKDEGVKGDDTKR